MDHLAIRHARLEPALDRVLDKDGARPGQRLGTADVIEQDFGELAVAQGAEGLGHVGRPIGR
jgi:hypothetical protein